MAKLKDYYAILGIRKDASEQEIKAAYRKLAKEYHPDVNKDYEELFKEINEAYSVLSDKEKREEYDNLLINPDENKIRNFTEYIQEFINSIFNGEREQKPKKGEDIRLKLFLSIEEAYLGTSKEIEYEKWIPCPECNAKGYIGEPDKVKCEACEGTGKRVSGIFSFPRPCSVCRGKGYIIKNTCSTCLGRKRIAKKSKLIVQIPPQTNDGDVLKVVGKGHAGFGNKEPGDLYLRVFIQDHEIYKKVGNDIHVELPISYADAVLGANIKFKWIDGKDLDVFIQPGAECGSQKVLPGLGFHNGNLIFHIKIQIPKQLSKKQQKLIEELRKLEHEEDSKSIIGIVKNILQR